MKVRQYLTNPVTNDTQPSKTQSEIKKLNDAYKTLTNKISYIAYTIRDRFIYHILIPSTKNENNSYDVILEFVTHDKVKKSENLLDVIPVKVFSNCPSFIFKQLVPFYNNGLLCEWLKDKYNPTTRGKLPRVKQHSSDIGLERSIFLAMKYFIDMGLYTKTQTSHYKKISSEKEILEDIRTQDQIMENIKPKVEKDEVKRISPEKSASAARNKKISMSKVPSTKSIKTNKTSSHITNTTKTKKTKQI